MVALEIEMGAQLWSPFGYDMNEWAGTENVITESNVCFNRDYGGYSSGHMLGSPHPSYSLKRCQGFVRCDMDIDAEVVGWVIGKNGAAIKDLKNKTGCNMWVDQRALKLTITGPDPHIVEHAARSVQAYVAAAPIKAGAVEAAVTRSLECPPHLLDVLGDRATIARIVKETRAQVVVNKKMARAIIRGRPHPVQMACSKVQDIISNAAAEYSKANSESTGNRAGHRLNLSDHEMNSTYPLNGIMRSPTDSLTATESPFNSKSNRMWSLFSGPAAFSTTNVAPICGTPQSTIDHPVTSGTKFFAASPNESDTNNVPSTNTSPLSFVKAEKQCTDSSTVVHDSDSLNGEIESVSFLLTSLKLEKYSTAFEENEVDMDAVRLMSESDFTDLGIPKGPRLKIMNAVWAVTPRKN